MKIATTGAVLTLAAALMVSPRPAAAQVADLDLERFSGRWYEIARNPNRFQRDCTRLSVDFTSRGEPGRYRVEVHNWAGLPATRVDLTMTFLNSAGEPGPAAG